MSDTLPKGWAEIDLDKVVIYGKGKKPKKLSTNSANGMVPYINIKAFEQGIIDEYADVPSSKLITEDDILVVWDGARFGLSGMGMIGAAGSTLMVLTPVINFPKYVYNFIYGHYTFINSKPKGTGTPHVNPDIFWKLQFPIAPLNEQKRIITKLNKIIPRIDAVKERLDKVPAIIKRFRQSVLTAAVTGKLTEKWREEHPEVESAEVLLVKAKELKQKKYEYECKIAKNEKKRKPQRYFFDSSEIDFEDIDLPESWTPTLLGNISYVKGGLQKTPKRKPANNYYKYITVANVYRGFLKLDDLSSFEATKVEFNKLKLEKNDLLIVEGNGSAKEIGRCSIWNNEINDCIHQNHIIRSRPIVNIIDNKYSLLFFNSNFGIKIMMDIASTTSGLYTLSVSKVNNLPIPLPPLEEQKEIGRQVDIFFTIADKLEKHYRNAKAKVDKLSQSVLAKAFRGELVPQDPNDEPAEKLLERIQEEKRNMETELKKDKKRRKKRRIDKIYD